MRGNAHVRFGSAGRGNGRSERSTPRPGPILTSRWRGCLISPDDEGYGVHQRSCPTFSVGLVGRQDRTRTVDRARSRR
jgi:hypothetical protein